MSTTAMQPNPLWNLQVGLDALNGRAEPPPPMSPPPMPEFHPVPEPGGTDAPQRLDQLAAVLGNGDTIAAMAAAVGAGENMAAANAPAPRNEPLTRMWVAKPPDLSKLPPGLAASLARLAGGPAPSGPAPGMPPPLRRNGRTPQ